MQVANELDLLSVAIRNVLRAEERIPEERRPAVGDRMRWNCCATSQSIETRWADGRPTNWTEGHLHIEVGGVADTRKESWIGGVNGVPLSRITAWLVRVWRALES